MPYRTPAKVLYRLLVRLLEFLFVKEFLKLSTTRKMYTTKNINPRSTGIVISNLMSFQKENNEMK